jgi:hypothetical protein
MLYRPEPESVVVLVISLAAVGMTVAALLLPSKEPAQVAQTAAAPAARAVVPAARAGRRPATPRPVAGAEHGMPARQRTPAGMPAAEGVTSCLLDPYDRTILVRPRCLIPRARHGTRGSSIFIGRDHRSQCAG